MKAIGSAVLTALKAKTRNIDEMDMLITNARFDAVTKGVNDDKWVDAFWSQMGLIESQRIAKNINEGVTYGKNSN